MLNACWWGFSGCTFGQCEEVATYWPSLFYINWFFSFALCSVSQTSDRYQFANLIQCQTVFKHSGDLMKWSPRASSGRQLQLLSHIHIYTPISIRIHTLIICPLFKANKVPLLSLPEYCLCSTSTPSKVSRSRSIMISIVTHCSRVVVMRLETRCQIQIIASCCFNMSWLIEIKWGEKNLKTN